MKVAVDTCVFEQLFNPSVNEHGFITALLQTLSQSEPKLLVDSTSKLANEYAIRLVPKLEKGSDEGDELIMLRFWMNIDLREKVDLVKTDRLMNSIYVVINDERKHADRALVYIALRSGSWAISNDGEDVLRDRAKLMRETRRDTKKGGDIVSAKYAFQDVHKVAFEEWKKSRS